MSLLDGLPDHPGVAAVLLFDAGLTDPDVESLYESICHLALLFGKDPSKYVGIPADIADALVLINASVLNAILQIEGHHPSFLID